MSIEPNSSLSELPPKKPVFLLSYIPLSKKYLPLIICTTLLLITITLVLIVFFTKQPTTPPDPRHSFPIENWTIDKSTAQAPSNWLLYQDSQFFYNFILHYPPDWNFATTETAVYFYPFNYQTHCGDLTNIESSTNCLFFKISEVKPNTLTHPTSGEPLIIDHLPTTALGNNNYHLFQHEFEGIRQTNYYLIFNQESALELSYMERYLSSTSSATQTINQIASTLTIVPRTTDSVSQKWKTYQNTYWDYEFKYPDFLSIGYDLASDDQVGSMLIDLDTLGEPHNPNIPPAIRFHLLPHIAPEDKDQWDKMLKVTTDNPNLITSEDTKIYGFNGKKFITNDRNQYSNEDRIHTQFYIYWKDNVLILDFYNSYHGGGIVTEPLIKHFTDNLILE